VALLAAAAILALAVGGSLFSASLAAKPRMGVGPARALTKPKRTPLYWGAWIGKQLTGTGAPYDMSAVSTFEQMVGKPLSLIEWAVPFSDCAFNPCRFFNFPVQQMNDVRAYGAIPFLSWSSAAISTGGDPTVQPDYQLSDVTAGAYDDYIRQFATQARDWGHPLFLRFDWEMNGAWFPWGVKANGNSPADYVPAWRHVHDIFTSVGATNVTWVWCPYVDTENQYDLRQFYPGGAYVDWTCLDAYNWAGAPANPHPWQAPGKLIDSTYNKVVQKIAPRKPMILAEVASSDFGGDKAAWISQLFNRIKKRYSKVAALIWFDVNDRDTHWPLEGSQAAIDAFARGVSDPHYLPNGFGNIDGGPIAPPGG
jgi:hypothetical protein